MARLSENIYNLLYSNLTIPEIWEGYVPEEVDVDEGALTFQRLPSPASDDVTGTSLAQYQFSIRHSDLGVAQDYRKSLEDLLIGWSGDLDDYKKVNFFQESDLGDVQEDDTQLWVLTSIFNIKYVR